MADLDMNNRDPNDMNSHIKVAFEDVIAEPDSVHSMDCVWSNSYKCFQCGKALCYKIMTALCGICIALFWGCDFAITAFNHVWCYTPCIRDLSIAVGCCQNVFATLINCCCVPVCTAMGMCLSKINITNNK